MPFRDLEDKKQPMHAIYAHASNLCVLSISLLMRIVTHNTINLTHNAINLTHNAQGGINLTHNAYGGVDLTTARDRQDLPKCAEYILPTMP